MTQSSRPTLATRLAAFTLAATITFAVDDGIALTASAAVHSPAVQTALHAAIRQAG